MLIAKGDYENARMCEDDDGTEQLAPKTHMQQVHEVTEGEDISVCVAVFTHKHRKTIFSALFHK